MDELETKYAALAESEVSESGEIAGYASLFNVRDQGGDTVAPGAYAKSLATGRRPKMLWSHDPAQPIGVWSEVAEDEKGLRVKGKLALDVEKGRETHALLRAGAIDGLSIGYRTLRADRKSGGRLLQELDLWEISLVTFPMLATATVDSVKMEATVAAAKAGDYTPLKRAVERALRDAGFPAWLAKAQAALAPTALDREGSRDAAAAQEIANAMRAWRL